MAINMLAVTFRTGMGGTNVMCSPSIQMTANGLQCDTFVTASGMFNCPAGGGGCRGILARLALTMAMGPTPHTCAIMCDCGFGAGVETFTISNADGLPVELLDFKVSALDSPRRASAPAAPASETAPSS